MKEEINNVIEQIRLELRNRQWPNKAYIEKLEARLERLEQLYEDLYEYI